MALVTVLGSPTTGTYRPYGLDCFGFVDWVFFKATDGAYIFSHGGGWDENGNLMIIHCSSGRNNVVITGAGGFSSVAKPVYFQNSF